MFKWILPHFRRYIPFFVLAALLGVCSTVALFLVPDTTKIIIDNALKPAISGDSPKENSSFFMFLIAGVAADNYWQILLYALAAFGILVVTRHILHYARWNIAHMSGVAAEKRLRTVAFNKMLRLDPETLGIFTPGELLTLNNSDCINSKEIFTGPGALIVQHSIEICLAAFFLFRINPYFAIAPFISAGLIAALASVYLKKVARAYTKIRSASIRLNTNVQQNIKNAKQIRESAAGEAEIVRFDEYNENLKKMHFEQANLWSKYTVIFMAVTYTTQILSTILGIYLVINGMSEGDFAAFMIYVVFINTAVQAIANATAGTRNLLISAKRVAGFLNLPEKEAE